MEQYRVTTIFTFCPFFYLDSFNLDNILVYKSVKQLSTLFNIAQTTSVEGGFETFFGRWSDKADKWCQWLWSTSLSSSVYKSDSRRHQFQTNHFETLFIINQRSFLICNTATFVFLLITLEDLHSHTKRSSDSTIVTKSSSVKLDDNVDEEFQRSDLW